MSLPVGRRPNGHAPIVRSDCQYTLVINPKPVVDVRGGRQTPRSLGVTYGSLRRHHDPHDPLARLDSVKRNKGEASCYRLPAFIICI